MSRSKFANAEEKAKAAAAAARARRERILFSIVPLLDALDCEDISSSARRIGIAREEIYRRLESGLTVDQADQLACAAGFHPCEIWGAAWWDEDRDHTDYLFERLAAEREHKAAS